MMSSTIDNWDSELIMPNLLHQLDLLERNYAGERGKQKNHSLLGEIFQDKYSDVSNKKITSAKQSFQCSICEKLFTAAANLKRHIETIHCNKTRYYKCGICEKSFTTKQGMQNHERTHTGERPFKCSYCDKSFKSWGARYAHGLAIHAKDKTHSCEKCGNKFVFSSQLKNHMKTHSKENAYECSNFETNKSHVNFQNSGEQHQKSFGEKCFKGSNKKNKNLESLNNDAGPHKCFLCQKTFQQLHNLENHWLIHTKESNLFQFGFENTNLEVVEIELLI